MEKNNVKSSYEYVERYQKELYQQYVIGTWDGAFLYTIR